MSLTSLLRRTEVRKFMRAHVHRPRVLFEDPDPLVPALAPEAPRIAAAYAHAIWLGLEARGWARRGDGRVAPDPGELTARALAEVSGWPAEGAPTTEQVRGCLRLAMLDVFARAPEHGVVEEPTADECEEVQALLELVPWWRLKPRSIGLAHPRFGPASRVVGGACADLLVDDMLVDTAVTAEPEVSAATYRKLACCALMANRYGAAGQVVEIRWLGVLSGRTGELVTWRLEECVPPDHADHVLDWMLRVGERVTGG